MPVYKGTWTTTHYNEKLSFGDVTITIPSTIGLSQAEVQVTYKGSYKRGYVTEKMSCACNKQRDGSFYVKLVDKGREFVFEGKEKEGVITGEFRVTLPYDKGTFYARKKSS